MPKLKAVARAIAPKPDPGPGINDVLKALESLSSRITALEAKDVDLEPVLSAVGGIPEPEKVDFSSVLAAIKAIRIPEPEKVDLSPVLKAIQAVKIPEPEKMDVTPVLMALGDGFASIKGDIKGLSEAYQTAIDAVLQADRTDEILRAVEALKKLPPVRLDVVRNRTTHMIESVDVVRDNDG